MKRVLILCLGLIAFFSANAQYIQSSQVKSSKEPWKYGVKAGGSFDRLSIKSGCTSKVGYKVGLIAEKRLVYNLYFQPSLSFVKKGFEYEIRKGFRLNVNAMLAEIDAGLLLKFGDDRLQKGFFLSLTPYYAYGFGGKSRSTDLKPDSENYNKETEYSTFENNNRGDIGFKLGCGYDFNKRFEISGNYTFGMNKFSNTVNYRWRAWSVQLILFF